MPSNNMIYDNISEGIFIDRPNRFIAKVLINSVEETAHVINTGRCRELLQKGNTVYLRHSDSPNRKTAWDLVSVIRQDGKLINMNSFAPNKLAYEWLTEGNLGHFEQLKPEQKFGNSRFDFAGYENGRQVLIEVKGCTLERDGIALFPDAPTERGLKHIQELTEHAKAGFRCIVLIVIQMKSVSAFCPNAATDPKFAKALKIANASGVEVIAVDCNVQKGKIRIDRRVNVLL